MAEFYIGPTFWDSGATSWDSGATRWGGISSSASVSAGLTSVGGFTVSGGYTAWDSEATVWDSGATRWDSTARSYFGTAGIAAGTLAAGDVSSHVGHTSWDSGATVWDSGATRWDFIGNEYSGIAGIAAGTLAAGGVSFYVGHTTWDSGATVWDSGATLWDFAGRRYSGIAGIAANGLGIGELEIWWPVDREITSGPVTIPAWVSAQASVSVTTGEIPVWYEDRPATGLWWNDGGTLKPADQAYRGSVLLWTSNALNLAGVSQTDAASEVFGTVSWGVGVNALAPATIAAGSEAEGALYNLAPFPFTLALIDPIHAQSGASAGLIVSIAVIAQQPAKVACGLTLSGDGVVEYALNLQLAGSASLAAATSAAAQEVSLGLGLSGVARIEAATATRTGVLGVRQQIPVWYEDIPATGLWAVEGGSLYPVNAIYRGSELLWQYEIFHLSPALAEISAETTFSSTLETLFPREIAAGAPAAVEAALVSSGTFSHTLPVFLPAATASIAAQTGASSGVDLRITVSGVASRSISAETGLLGDLLIPVSPVVQLAGVASIASGLGATGQSGFDLLLATETPIRVAAETSVSGVALVGQPLQGTAQVAAATRAMGLIRHTLITAAASPARVASDLTATGSLGFSLLLEATAPILLEAELQTVSGRLETGTGISGVAKISANSYANGTFLRDAPILQIQVPKIEAQTTATGSFAPEAVTNEGRTFNVPGFSRVFNVRARIWR